MKFLKRSPPVAKAKSRKFRSTSWSCFKPCSVRRSQLSNHDRTSSVLNPAGSTTSVNTVKFFIIHGTGNRERFFSLMSLAMYGATVSATSLVTSGKISVHFNVAFPSAQNSSETKT
ncbi:hypothetical protein D3C78_1453670 [compost metagenome]